MHYAVSPPALAQSGRARRRRQRKLCSRSTYYLLTSVSLVACCFNCSFLHVYENITLYCPMSTESQWSSRRPEIQIDSETDSGTVANGKDVTRSPNSANSWQQLATQHCVSPSSDVRFPFVQRPFPLHPQFVCASSAVRFLSTRCPFSLRLPSVSPPSALRSPFVSFRPS